MSAILVTGAAGFIGRKLVARLSSEGHSVVEFDVAQGDVTSVDDLQRFARLQIDHVFHLAGKTFVPDSWKNPFGFYQVNVMGTTNILEFCRKTGARLTYISSYLYGEPDYLPVDELHPVKSYNPYSQSKIIADSICQFYARYYNIQVTIFRPFNAFGPGQSALFLIPEIIEKVMNNNISEVEVMDLRPKRDYIFIDDLVDALVLSLNNQLGIYNIGSGYSKSVEEIIQHVMKHSGITKPYRSKAVTRPNEIFDLYAGISKAEAGLGWKPKTPFEEGIKQCIIAYNQNR